MIRFATRVSAVQTLLGPDAMVFEERAGWVIGICTNRKSGPPYAIDVYGEGRTFNQAWEEAARRVPTIMPLPCPCP